MTDGLPDATGTAPGDVAPFDRLAPLYELAMPPADADRLRAALATADRPLERGLDLGGGTGRGSRRLAGVDWTVVDAAPGMLRTARSRGQDGVAGDAARLPVRSASVDAVLVVDALHHFGRPRESLREVARVLRPGGVLVVAEFDPATLPGLALVTVEGLVGFDSTFWSPMDLAAMLEEAGLAPRVVEAGFGYAVAGAKPQDR